MIEIKSPQTREEFKDYYDLRYHVLREPFGMPRGTEKDDYEPISQHFMAIDSEKGKIAGVVKLLEKDPQTGWFSHLAISPEYQHRGIGRMLLDAVESESRRRGYSLLSCQSHLNTTGFFEKAGFEMAGMPGHYFGPTQVVWMEKKLDPQV